MFTEFPKSRSRPIWSNNPQVRLGEETRGRTIVSSIYSTRPSITHRRWSPVGPTTQRTRGGALFPTLHPSPRRGPSAFAEQGYSALAMARRMGLSALLQPPKTRQITGRKTILLLVAGGAVFLWMFWSAMSQPNPDFHPWRDAELKDTYATYIATGVPLIKLAGTGSPATDIDTGTGFSPSVWDDDPGIYLAASYIGAAISADDPYEGVRLAQAFTAALPWLLIPLLVARLFDSVVVGLAMIPAPLVMRLLVADGGALVGTDYGRPVVGGIPVYALYGAAGSLVFLGLIVALFAATFAARRSVLWTSAISLGVIAGVAGLTRSLSGFPVIAAGLIIIFPMRLPRLHRLAAGCTLIVLALLLPVAIMANVNAERSDALGISASGLPTAHPVWHTTYLGLGYIGYQDDYATENACDVRFSDQFAYDRAREIDPSVQNHLGEYESIIRSLYFDAVVSNPMCALRGYALKLRDVYVQQGPLLIFVLAVWAIGFKEGSRRRALTIGAGVALPAILIGTIPPVVVMPFRFFFVEHTAGLSLAFVVAAGWIVAFIAARRRSPESSPPLSENAPNARHDQTL